MYRQNDQADSVYVVVSGRLRSVMAVDNDSKKVISSVTNRDKQLLAEFGRHDFVGEMEVLTESAR